MQILKKSLKTLTRASLLLALIFGADFAFEEVRELSFQHTASKAAPFKVRGRTVCSSSQIEWKGKQYTLTNRHCCQVLARKKKGKKARLASYKVFETLEGKYAQIGDTLQEILSLDKKHDLCLLTPDKTMPALRVAKSYKINEPIHIIGHPRGMPQTIRPGRIVAVMYEVFYWVNPIHKLPMQLISAIGYGGNSGSPVVDRYGQLVGVIFAGSRVYHTEMGAVPLEAVREFLDRVVE